MPANIEIAKIKCIIKVGLPLKKTNERIKNENKRNAVAKSFGKDLFRNDRNARR